MLFLVVLYVASIVIYRLETQHLPDFFVHQILIAGCVALLWIGLTIRYQKFFLLFLIVEALVGARFLWLGVSKSDLVTPDYRPSTLRTFVSPEMFPVDSNYRGVSGLYSKESAAAFPLWGAPYGFRYAFDDSPEGLYSYYNDYLASFAASLAAVDKFRLLSHLGVNQIVTKQSIETQDWQRSSAENYFVYRKSSVLPEFFAAGNLYDGASPEQTLKGLLKNDASFARWKTEHSGFTVPESIQFKALSPSKYRIDIKAKAPVFLVTRITYFKTWKATGMLQDGTESPLRVNQVDLSFTGIEIPPGIQTVTLFYESRVRAGLLVVWGLLLMGASALVIARRPRLSQT